MESGEEGPQLAEKLPEELSVKVELLWRQYALWVGLYRDYLGFILRLNLFYYAITGALLSYYLGNVDKEFVRYALLLPILMSIMFAVLFFYGAALVPVMRTNLVSIASGLGLGAFPEFRVLIALLMIFGVLFLVVSAGLSWLFCMDLSTTDSS